MRSPSGEELRLRGPVTAKLRETAITNAARKIGTVGGVAERRAAPWLDTRRSRLPSGTSKRTPTRNGGSSIWFDVASRAANRQQTALSVESAEAIWQWGWEAPGWGNECLRLPPMNC